MAAKASDEELTEALKSIIGEFEGWDFNQGHKKLCESLSWIGTGIKEIL